MLMKSLVKNLYLPSKGCSRISRSRPRVSIEITSIAVESILLSPPVVRIESKFRRPPANDFKSIVHVVRIEESIYDESQLYSFDHYV